MSVYRYAIALTALLTALPAGAQQFDEQTASRFPTTPSEWTNQLTAGDIDNDGDLDLIFANGGNFSSAGPPLPVRVFINNGSGFFTDESNARTGGQTGSHRGVELGDCDGDGDLDMILAQDFNKLPNLMVNDGSGFYTNQTASKLPNLNFSSSRAQFGDIDNDGDLDLFITNGGTVSRFGCGQYRVYLNDGSCNYTDATSTNFPIGNVCENMDAIFGDIDGDFDLDIKTASTGSNNSKLYRNNGSGVFAEISAPSDATCYSYDFGDIDGDGDLDLLGANGNPGSNGEILLENNGNGSYTNITGQFSPNPNQDDNDSKFFDYDNDGDLDILIARLGSGGEKLYRNDGNGNFAQVTGVIEVISDSSLDIAVADVTGDGAYDIVTAQGESGNFTNRIYINNGPADTVAPNIVGVEFPSPLTDAGPWVIRAAVLDHMTSDRNFYGADIDLVYSIDGGADQSVQMEYSGGQIYRGLIPDQVGNVQVEYRVEAADSMGNVAVGSTQMFIVPECSTLNDCSGNGACVEGSTCDCNSGWDGDDCSVFIGDAAGSIESSLTVRRISLGRVRLQWGDSCLVGDTDFGVFSGAVGGAFAPDTQITCSTNNLNSAVVEPLAGDRFFLVVPQSDTAEGSYGTDSEGFERAPSANACLGQAVATCL